jgi:hypothetical protein
MAALANTLVASGLLIGTPFFVIFGWLSDKIGRKWIIILGCALAAATYFPIFKGITTYANPVLARAEATAPVVVSADPADLRLPVRPDRQGQVQYALRRGQGLSGQGRRQLQRPRGLGRLAPTR